MEVCMGLEMEKETEKKQSNTTEYRAQLLGPIWIRSRWGFCLIWYHTV